MSIRFLAAVVVLLVIPRTALAETPPTTFNAGGVHSIPLHPERVRLAIPLLAHALGPGEAIDLLRERKEEARERVLAAQGDPDSIRFASVGIENSAATLNTHGSAMRMLNAMGNAIEIDELPVLYTARTEMIVDWQLPQADEEATLAFVEQVVSGLKTPDVTGRDDRPEFTPKVEEALKALQEQSPQFYSSSGASNPDSIRYIFVASVSEEIIQRAVSEAFAEARQQIGAMTKAAGMQPGRLLSMSVSNHSHYITQAIHGGIGNRTRIDMLVPAADEVAAAQSGDLKYVAQVQTQFLVTE